MERSVLIRCTCGCSVLGIDRFDDDDVSDWYVEFYVTTGKKLPLREKLKAIWYIIRGKEYLMEDVILKKEDAERIKAIL